MIWSMLYWSKLNILELFKTRTIKTIFDEFDVQRMRLTEGQRLEKYRKMLESPFRFFRGSAYLFYFDMTKSASIFHTPDRKPTWIQGDMHMDNFGAFQNEAGSIVLMSMISMRAM